MSSKTKKKMEPSIKSSKDLCGRSLWIVIHSFAASYTPENLNMFKIFIISITELFPCKMCRDHFKATMKKIPVTKFLKNKEQLFMWTYIVHDLVNQEITKSGHG